MTPETFTIKPLDWQPRGTKSAGVWCHTPVAHFEIGSDGFMYSPYICKYPDFGMAIQKAEEEYKNLVLRCLVPVVKNANV